MATHTDRVANLRAVAAQAEPADWQAGAAWYPAANTLVRRLARQYDQRAAVVAAVVAALSPANKWTRNTVDAENVIRVWSATGDRDKVRAIKVATYNRNRDKAVEILATGDPTLLTGQKVTAFAYNLSAPDAGGAVIDRHAYNAVIGHREVVDVRGHRITAKRYRDAAAAYTDLAAELDISAASLQATVWLVWRRKLGLKNV